MSALGAGQGRFGGLGRRRVRAEQGRVRGADAQGEDGLELGKRGERREKGAGFFL